MLPNSHCHREEAKGRRGDPDNSSAYAGLLRFARNDKGSEVLSFEEMTGIFKQSDDRIKKYVFI